MEGAIPVEIARAGRYEFTLSRWPLSLDLPLRAATAGGRSLEIRQAGLQVAGQRNVRDVTGRRNSVKFVVPLEPGPVTLRAWFLTEKSDRVGAYFVRVRRLP